MSIPFASMPTTELKCSDNGTESCVKGWRCDESARFLFPAPACPSRWTSSLPKKRQRPSGCGASRQRRQRASSTGSAGCVFETAGFRLFHCDQDTSSVLPGMQVSYQPCKCLSACTALKAYGLRDLQELLQQAGSRVGQQGQQDEAHNCPPPGSLTSPFQFLLGHELRSGIPPQESVHRAPVLTSFVSTRV